MYLSHYDDRLQTRTIIIPFHLEFQTNDHWKHVAVQSTSITCVSQSYQHCDHERSCAEGL